MCSVGRSLDTLHSVRVCCFHCRALSHYHPLLRRWFNDCYPVREGEGGMG